MATTGIINGSIMLLYTSVDDGTTWIPIAHSTDNTLDVTGDTREANTKDSSGWREYLASFKSWTMSGESLLALDSAHGFTQLLAIMEADTVIKVKISSEVTGDKYWTGSALITSISMSTPMEDNGSMSYSIQGSGALTEATVS
mgnify:CR=1 FL=1